MFSETVRSEYRAEGLGQIASLGARLARRFAKHFGRSPRGFHHARQNLKGRGLAGTVGTDKAEDFAFTDIEADPSNRLERAVALPQVENANSRAPS